MLRYVNDIRLHPLKTFLNYGIRVSISPDDPHLWGEKAVVMDYYFATVGVQLGNDGGL